MKKSDKSEAMNYKVTTSEDTILIQMGSSVTEKVALPDVNSIEASSCTIDFGEVTYFNSSGIRKFVLWTLGVEKCCPNLQMRFKQVTPVVMNQLALVGHFIPANVIFSSIYFPFVCEDCDLESNILIGLEGLSAEAANDRILKTTQKVHACKSCNQPMIPGVSEAKYRLILKSQAS